MNEPVAPGRSRWRAPAKINPFLAVLGKRTDGYHELVTTLLALDWSDELVVDAPRDAHAAPRRATRTHTATPPDRADDDAPPARLVLRGPAASADIPTDARNLVLRAAELVRARAKAVTPPLAFELDKQVPSQAGLGGGSADAAAALLAAAHALDIELSATERGELLARLGSDCAFFGGAETGHAVCRGRGERVQTLPVPRPGWYVALVVPKVGSPTAAVYAALATSLRAPAAAPSVPDQIFELEEGPARALLRNDLEPAALRAVPPLARVRERLDACGAQHWRLSGSGSSFYGIYRDAECAARDLQRIELELRASDCAVRAARVCRPLGRAVHRIDAGDVGRAGGG